MRTKTWQAQLTLIFVTMLVVSFAKTSHADWADSFSGGTTDQFWQFGSDGGNAATFLGGQVINDQLVLTASATPGDGGAQTGFGVVITEIFSDVRMTGVINPGGDVNINDTVGLLIRGNTVNQTFYMAEVNYSSGNLIIFRNNPAFPGGSADLATAPIPNLDLDESVYVEIEAIGSQLEVWAYADATKSTLRATTSVEDTSEAALSSGLSGVLANENFAGLPMLGVWDDVTASVISTGVPSDFDDDGDVDGADFLEIQREFGTTTTSQDIIDWQSNYGPMPLSAVSSVPEPSTLTLACGLLLLCRTGGRRR